MKDGFHFMTDKDYFAFDGLSNSFLKGFDRSPAHAYHDIEKTAAMRLGTFGHAYLLSDYEYNKLIKAPSHFEDPDDNYEEKPLLNRKNKPWGAYKKEHPEVDPKEGIILHHEQESFKQIKEYLLDYNIFPGLKFGKIYEKCRKEEAVIYFDMELGLYLKGKLDLLFLDPDMPMIFDPKFTTNSKDLGKKICDKGLKYYRQAAFYSDLVEKITGKLPIFYFIGIETDPPYGIDFFLLSDELLELGRWENQMSIDKYIEWSQGEKRIYPSWEGFAIVEKPGYLKIKKPEVIIGKEND